MRCVRNNAPLNVPLSSPSSAKSVDSGIATGPHGHYGEIFRVVLKGSVASDTLSLDLSSILIRLKKDEIEAMKADATTGGGDQMCSMCLDPVISSTSMISSSPAAGHTLAPVDVDDTRMHPVRLSRCHDHYFHEKCIVHALTHKPQCPMCAEIYALPRGKISPLAIF